MKKIGVDTGGTFTDIVMHINGGLFTHKVLSTPQNPAHAVIRGMDEILRLHNIVGVAPCAYPELEIVHGSTVATNALLERRGARIALVTTKGFEDVLEIGRQARPSLYDFFAERPAPLIPANRRFGISERTLYTGDIQTGIESSELDALATQLATLELDAIAICFLFSYVNPQNEQIVAKHLETLEIPISCSHQILPEYREYARFSTTVANAYIRPTLEKHLSTLLHGSAPLISAAQESTGKSRQRPLTREEMEPEQFTTALRLMLSNGGSISARTFQRSLQAENLPDGGQRSLQTENLPDGGQRSLQTENLPDGGDQRSLQTENLPDGGDQRSLQAENLPDGGESAGIRTVLSGPAGGVIGAYHVAKTAGYEQIITFDMGGTSTDVSLCNNGISMTTESIISGLPIKVPLIDIHTVGAGGGSIATIDSGGAVRVGPESAGAAPGPICYGKHGENITVTDANLFLGRIAPTQFLGGQMSLDSDKTRTYIEKFASRLGISPLQAADGILKVANATMERAIKVISVERGFDTRDFTLVSFGGAGGLHAAFLAENLGIHTVLIPPNGGLLSAYGMLFADVIKDYSQTVLWKFEKQDEGNALQLLERLNTGFDTLLAQAESDMQTEGFAPAQLKIERSLDMRYEGQSYELNIPYAQHSVSRCGEHHYCDEFHAAHAQRFSYARPEATVEVVNLRLTAIGETEKPTLHAEPFTDAEVSDDARVAQKPVLFDRQAHPTDFYRREALRPGNQFEGPAIVTEFSATTVIPPHFSASVDAYQNLILRHR